MIILTVVSVVVVITLLYYTINFIINLIYKLKKISNITKIVNIKKSTYQTDLSEFCIEKLLTKKKQEHLQIWLRMTLVCGKEKNMIMSILGSNCSNIFLYYFIFFIFIKIKLN